ncbi:MAG: hypothetical protein GF364_00440 [Candidatus Lokiarchaeota archaeon]|nr:hypothetical protein [Candidatus Lokiarchaeota archaeon]
MNISYQLIPDGNINYIDIDVSTDPLELGDPDVNSSNTDYAKYHVLKDGNEIISGDLNYIEPNHFKVTGISLKFKGSGTYAVWVEISYLGTVTSTEDQINGSEHYIDRSKPLEDFMWYAIIIVSLVILAIIAAIIVSKRSRRETKKRMKIKQKTGPIEVIDFKQNAQRLSAKKKEKKKKGVTEANEDLIFSVPKWEVDELENGSEEDSTSMDAERDIISVATEKKSGFSMHCPSCNAWFEIDEYIVTDCPECGTALSLAMYCPNDDKWFDVPEPGKYECPICSKQLKYSK